jgi:pantetheine-phosphate adenylyltransferase
MTSDQASAAIRIAVYAGTFDPITKGHLSVIERAARMFDRLVVVVAVNPNKRPLFSVEERLAMIADVTRAWPNVEAASTQGYVVELARSAGARYLVRGVRGITDIEAETALAHMNHELAPEVETVFIPAHAALSEVSSSRLKQLASEGADLAHYCPPEIIAPLRERVALPLGTPLENCHE